MAFYFEKPDGFNFIAGQYMTVTLTNPPETDDEGNSRFFSITSAPSEDCLVIATRMRDTAFKRVLKDLPAGSEIKIDGPKENQNFKLVATMTAPTQGRSPDQSVGKNSKMSWTGETGYINKEMLKKYIQDINQPIYYMSGPPAMVKAMRELAEKIGASDDNIKFEEFTGY